MRGLTEQVIFTFMPLTPPTEPIYIKKRKPYTSTETASLCAHTASPPHPKPYLRLPSLRFPAMASNEPHPRNEEDAPDAAAASVATAAAAAEDEDTGAHVAPIVHLEEVAVTTGEEHEDVLLDL